MTSGEDGFLSRWARRKQQVREEDEREAAVAPSSEVEVPAASEAALPTEPDRDQRDTPPDEETRQQWIEELEAIDIDTLNYDNDFTVFMKSWVPGALRQRALRKLWTTNPALAVLDGLNDYDLDYTDKAMRAGTVVSSYMPGKGYASLEETIEKVAALADAGEEGAAEDVADIAGDEIAPDGQPSELEKGAGDADPGFADSDSDANGKGSA